MDHRIWVASDYFHFEDSGQNVEFVDGTLLVSSPFCVVRICLIILPRIRWKTEKSHIKPRTSDQCVFTFSFWIFWPPTRKSQLGPQTLRSAGSFQLNCRSQWCDGLLNLCPQIAVVAEPSSVPSVSPFLSLRAAAKLRHQSVRNLLKEQIRMLLLVQIVQIRCFGLVPTELLPKLVRSNVGFTLRHPQVITTFMGDLFTIPSHGRFVGEIPRNHHSLLTSRSVFGHVVVDFSLIAHYEVCQCMAISRGKIRIHLWMDVLFS